MGKYSGLKSKIEEKAEELRYTLDLIIEDPSLSNNVKADTVIHATALICAIVAVQPLPFADLFILSPIQVVMVTYLSKILGLNNKNTSPQELLVYLVGTLGWGVLSQQVVLGLYKTIVPYAGGLTTIPLVYMATFGLGVACKALIKAKIDNITISKNTLKKIRDEAIESIKKEQRNFSIESIKEQFHNLKPQEFEIYKKSLTEYDNKLRFISTDNLNDDILKIIDDKARKIKCRFSRYNNISLEDSVLKIDLTLFNEKKIIDIENIIAKISRREIDINFNYGRSYNSYKGEYDNYNIMISKHGNIFSIDSIDSESGDNEKLKELISKKGCKLNHIRNQEIREKFLGSIEEAQYEVDIASPWISDKVMDEELIKKIERALNRGVHFKIIYGIKGNSRNKSSYDYRGQMSDKIAMELCNRFDKFKSNFKIMKVDSHYKVLICDEKFYIEGSYNFLSFKGEYIDDQRDEGASYGESKEYIRNLRNLYFKF